MAERDDGIIFGTPQNGIAKSPHLGIADCRQLDIHSEPGIAKLNEGLELSSTPRINQTFTVTDVANNIITLPSNADNFTGTAVNVSNSGGALPAGLAAATNYFLIRLTSTTFKLATSITNANAGTAVDITGTGTGTHTIVTVNMGTPKHLVTEPFAGVDFLQDSNGRVWYNGGSGWLLLNGNTLTNSAGNGLACIGQGFLLVFRNAILDVCNVSTSARMEDPVGTSSWTTAWQNLNSTAGSGNPHNTYTMDGIVYFCDDRYVGRVEELTTFDPSSAPTYSYDNQDLTLSRFLISADISELGSELAIGAYNIFGASRNSWLYLWDMESPTWRTRLSIPENVVYDMKNILGTLFISAGGTGTIYATIGTVVEEYWKVPEHISRISEASFGENTRIRALEFHRNRLFFTLECVAASGVWSLTLDGLKRAVLEYQYSVGSYGTLNPINAYVLAVPQASQLTVGWNDVDGGTAGVDMLRHNNFAYVGNYGAYIVWDFRQIGSNRHPETKSLVEASLAKMLGSGEGIRISARKDLNDSFTTVGTFDNNTYPDAISHAFNNIFANAENIQLKAEILGGTQTTPKLRSLILWP